MTSKTKEKKLIERMMSAYPYCVVSTKAVSEYIGQGGQVDVDAFRAWMQANGWWRTYYDILWLP